MQDEKMPKKKLVSKKRLLIIGLSILAILAIIFIVKITYDNLSKSGVTIESANVLKGKAIKALKDDDSKLAKDLFEQAQQQYEKLGDTNNVVDTKAQIYLIEHASK